MSIESHLAVVRECLASGLGVDVRVVVDASDVLKRSDTVYLWPWQVESTLQPSAPPLPLPSGERPAPSPAGHKVRFLVFAPTPGLMDSALSLLHRSPLLGTETKVHVVEARLAPETLCQLFAAAQLPLRAVLSYTAEG